MSDQVYCSFKELWEDQRLEGFEFPEATLDMLRSASEWIEKKIGRFIPLTATKSYDGRGTRKLFLDPLISIDTSGFTHDGDTLATTDYVLKPNNKHWENGPYTWVVVDPDASNLSYFKRERDVVSIAGKWGKYSDTLSTGATVQDDPQAAGGTTLLVDNGGLISPGDTLLIESEQELVTGYSGSGTDCGKNNSGAISTIDDTTIVMEAAHGLSAGEVIRIGNEQMYIKRIEDSNTLIVIRGFNGTLKATHLDAQDVYVYRTFTVERGVNGTTAAAHVQTTAISKYRVPAPIKYLAKQIATLMLRKAGTGYQGKVANLDAGEVFYMNEFPKDQVEMIRQEFRC